MSVGRLGTFPDFLINPFVTIITNIYVENLSIKKIPDLGTILDHYAECCQTSSDI